MKADETTIVADVGARYGLHPTWNNFQGPLRYVAFEPDKEEADRLREVVKSTPTFKYEVLESALDKQTGERDFYLLRHRGLSSFLKPDLSSECFRHLKPGQAEIDEVIKIKTETLDSIFAELGADPDFIKIDTEGTEQDVLEGCARVLETSVLGVRLSCNFQPCFEGQRLFSEHQDYLLARGFILLNLDYKGFGFPRLGLFRKPDPMEPEDFRYGVLVHADGVWVRKPELVRERFSGRALAVALLKHAYFSMLNNAPDYAIDTLREAASAGELDAASDTLLYKALRLRVARFLGRWRTVPDDQWEKARTLFESIFGEPLQGGSGFYPQVHGMTSELEAARR